MTDTVCTVCKLKSFTYNGICHRCTWEQMHHWKTQAEVFAGIIRSAATNTAFVQYENDRRADND
jgi:hypothetical protein